ncbi:exonuclease sbcCD subunit D [Deltaproteobacteria bacterium Smac51]|nr:exonuclease sbcCD subunit D [Deltaproteobacteria bacterium Smac51]
MEERLRILHTSDWHLGRALCGRRRYDEFAAFLDWLASTIEQEKVDILLIAGDIFDVGAPSARAQSLYYNFLGRIAASRVCGHVVIIAGNHDSPLFLNAPSQILKALDIHIVTTAATDVSEEIIPIKDGDGQTRLIVAAVPYPRDRDIRESTAGESTADKDKKLIEAISAHYAGAAEAAESLLAELPGPPPMVAMGHLFAAGGETAPDDMVRDLYVGSLGRVPGEAFPACFDYVALGHLHLPQIIAGDPSRRYSGSPLAMTFGEASRPKSVCLIDFKGPDNQMEITTLNVPVFQRLHRVSGDWERIEAEITELNQSGEAIWLEVEYTGAELIGDLRERLWELTEGGRLEILRIRNQRLVSRVLEGLGEGESLADLNEAEVFQRCLDQNSVIEEERAELLTAYGEILKAMREDEAEAEA